MGKLLLEAFLTLVEIGHAILVILPRAVGACGAARPRVSVNSFRGMVSTMLTGRPPVVLPKSP
jgi:hypothetical protein